MQGMERLPLKNRQLLEQAGAIALLALLVLFCVAVLKPFFTAMLWAAILVFATWPVFRFVRRRVARGNGAVAAAVMTVVWTLLVVVPLVVLARSSLHGLNWGLEHVQSFRSDGLPKLVQALRAHPLFSAHAEEIKEVLSSLSGDTERLTQWGFKAARAGGEWLLRRGVSIGWGIFQAFASLLFMFYFYLAGERLAAGTSRLMERIGGPFMARLQVRMGRTLEVVVRGTVGTAVVQGIVAGIGFRLFGVPNAGLWGVATFVMGLVPFGPPMVWVPIGLWLLASGEVKGGIGMLIYGGLGISGIDNVVRPLLIAGSGNFGRFLHRRQEMVTGAVLGTLTGAAFAFVGMPWQPGILVAGLVAFSSFSGAAEVALLSGTIWLFSTQRLVDGLWLFLMSGAMIFVQPLLVRFVKRHVKARATEAAAAKPAPEKAGEMPFALVFIGVTGGLMAFGFIGLFLGPVLLALGYDVVLALAAENRPRKRRGGKGHGVAGALGPGSGAEGGAARPAAEGAADGAA